VVVVVYGDVRETGERELLKVALTSLFRESRRRWRVRAKDGDPHTHPCVTTLVTKRPAW
jgi:hypothetical protein